MTDPVAALRAALARTGGRSSDFDLNPDTVLPAGRKLRAGRGAGARLAGLGRAAGDPDQAVVGAQASSRPDRLSRRQAGRERRRRRSPPRCARRMRRSGCPRAGRGSRPPARARNGHGLPDHAGGRRAGPTTSTPVPEPGEVDEVFSVPLVASDRPGQLPDRIAPLARRSAPLLHRALRPLLHLGRDGADPARARRADAAMTRLDCAVADGAGDASGVRGAGPGWRAGPVRRRLRAQHPARPCGQRHRHRHRCRARDGDGAGPVGGHQGGADRHRPWHGDAGQRRHPARGDDLPPRCRDRRPARGGGLFRQTSRRTRRGAISR